MGAWCSCCLAALIGIFVVARWFPEVYHNSSYASLVDTPYPQFSGKPQCVLVPTSSDASFELLEQIVQPHEVFEAGSYQAKISDTTARTLAIVWFFVVQWTASVFQLVSRVVGACSASIGWNLLDQLPDMPLFAESMKRGLDMSASVAVWSLFGQALFGTGIFLMFLRPVELSLMEVWRSHTVRLPSLFTTSRAVSDGSLQSFAPVGPSVFSAFALIMAIFEIFSNAVHNRHMSAVFLHHAEGHYNGAFFAVVLNVVLLVFLPGYGIPSFLQLLAQFVHMSTGALLIIGALSLPSDWAALSSAPGPHERVYCPSLNGSHSLSPWNEVVLFAALLASAVLWRLFADEPTTDSFALEPPAPLAVAARVPPRARAGSVGAAAGKQRPIPPTFTESKPLSRTAAAMPISDSPETSRATMTRSPELPQVPAYREFSSGFDASQLRPRPATSDVYHLGNSNVGGHYSEGAVGPSFPPGGPGYGRVLAESGGSSYFGTAMPEATRPIYTMQPSQPLRLATGEQMPGNYQQQHAGASHARAPEYSSVHQGSHSNANLQYAPRMSHATPDITPAAVRPFGWPSPPLVDIEGRLQIHEPTFRHASNVSVPLPTAETSGIHSGVKRSRASAPPADEEHARSDASNYETDGDRAYRSYAAVPVPLPAYQYVANHDTVVPEGWYGVYQQQQFQPEGELEEHVFKRLRM